MKKELLDYLKSLPQNNQNILEKSGFYNQARLMRIVETIPPTYSHKTLNDREIQEFKSK